MEAFQRQEVRHWVQEAIAFYKTAGKEATLREIDKPDGQFVQNEHNLLATDLEGNVFSNPRQKQLTGRSAVDLTDILLIALSY